MLYVLSGSSKSDMVATIKILLIELCIIEPEKN